MKPILSALAVFALGLAAMTDDPNPAEATKTAIEQFSGTWEIVAVQPPGSTKERETRRNGDSKEEAYQVWAEMVAAGQRPEHDAVPPLFSLPRDRFGQRLDVSALPAVAG